MPSNAGTGFASGFVGSLANALGAKQERQRQLQERQRQGFLTAYKVLADQGYGPDELQPFLAGGLPEVFGEKAPKAKAGQVDPAKTIGDILNKSLTSSRGTPLQPGPAASQPAQSGAPQPSGDNLQPGGALDTGAPPVAPTGLPSSQIAIPPAPPAQHTIDVNGQPFTFQSREQLAQRKQQAELDLIKRQIIKARELLPTLKQDDPNATIFDAMKAMKVDVLNHPEHRFTPVAIGRPLAAADVPADAVDQQGKPIDKTTAPYWQPVRGTTGEMFYQPGAQPTSTGSTAKPGSEGFHLLQWAKENGVDPKDLTPDQIEQARKDFRSAGWAGKASEEEKTARAKDIAKAIVEHRQPPDLSRMYGLSAYVRDELAKSDYNLTEATLDWTATQRYLNSLNGPQQLRFRQATGAVPGYMDSIEDLAKQWDAGAHMPLLNKVNLEAAKNGSYGRDAAAIATQLDTQIADAVADLAVIYQGGGTPTSAAFELAAKNLSASWDKDVLLKNVALVRKNIKIREGSLATGPAGTSENNPYVPGATPPAAAPPPAGGATGGGTIAGAVMKDGHLYINGKQID